MSRKPVRKNNARARGGQGFLRRVTAMATVCLGAALVAASMMSCGGRADSGVNLDGLVPSSNLLEEFRFFLPVPSLSGPLAFGRIPVQGKQVEVLSATREGAALRYYLDVPAGAHLECGYAVADDAPKGRYAFRVTASSRLDRDVEIMKGSLKQRAGGTGDRGTAIVDLSRFSGRIIQLAFLLTEPQAAAAAEAPLAGWDTLRVFRDPAAGGEATEASPQPGGAREPPSAAAETRTEELRKAAAKANIIIVLFDAARASRFGCYGYDRPTTPNVDGLSKRGIRFDRAYTQAVYTVASIGTLFSGLYPQRHGAMRRQPILDDVTTLATYLHDRGFATRSFIATHNAGPAFGYARGFDEVSHVKYDPVTGKELAQYATLEMFPPRLFPWLEEHRKERFFLYVHTVQPHLPYNSPASIKELFLRDGGVKTDWNIDLIRDINKGRVKPSKGQLTYLNDLYDANLRYADRFMGELLEKLRSLNLLRNSVIVFLADHGEGMYEHGIIGHNVSVYEESVRVPLVVVMPGGSPPFTHGLVVREPVGIIDITPTLLDLAGVPGGGPFQGESLLPLVAADAAPATARAKDGGTPGTDRYLVAITAAPHPTFAFIKGKEKIILDRTGNVERYDLESDPGERYDLSHAFPLKAKLKAQEAVAWYGRQLSGSKLAGERPDAQMDEQMLEDLKALGYTG